MALFGILLPAVEVQAQDLAADRAALVALYNATGGPNWDNNTNWLSEEPVGDWYGVTVTDGRVTRLDLNENELTGSIPTQLGDLTNLQRLNLYSNQLTGSIPTELGNLANLTYLELSDNQLTGTIPSQLGNLASLRELDLSENGLTGTIPTQLGNLANLRELGLDYNQLTGTIPTELGNLTNLRALGLYNNQLTGTIPSQLGNLTNLEWLELYNNQLTGAIPTELGNLSSLLGLHLYNNRLTGTIPAELGNLANLWRLDLSDNQLTGFIPSSFTHLGALDAFYFNLNPGLCAQEDNAIRNWLNGLWPVAGPDCSPTVRLSVAPTRLVEGSGPTKVTVTASRTAVASDTEVSLLLGGSAQEPDGTHHGIIFEEFESTDYRIDGTLNLTIPANSASGTTTLTFTPLEDSVDEGEETIILEADLQERRRGTEGSATLTLIDMAGAGACAATDRAALEALYNATGGASWNNNTNWLSEEPLNEWYGVSADDNGCVTRLSLDGNQLTGSIPSQLGNLANLESLDLSDNQLTGTIPADLGNLGRLQDLDLSGNQLTGSIPQSFTELEVLEFFSFARNSGLCAPADDAFQSWLRAIPEGYEGPNCSADNYSIPEKTPLTYPTAGSVLDDLIAIVASGEITAEEAAQEAPLHRGDAVAVTIHLSRNVDGVVTFLQNNGVTPRNRGEDYIEAFVPIRLLGAVSQQTGVLRMRMIQPPQENQMGVPGNGPTVHGSPAWNQAGYDGNGMRVGIIDLGFQGFTSLIGTELPANVRAMCFNYTTASPPRFTHNLSDCESFGGSHGTVVAESVRDIAPAAELFIANPWTPADLRDSVEWMAINGVDVINHSVGWFFDGPGDGTSPNSVSPLNTVDLAVGRGIVWVNSAGNDARKTWFKRAPLSPYVINFKDLDSTNRISLGRRQGIRVQLRWDDNWGGAARDLDLCIGDSATGAIIRCTNDPQTGVRGQIPFEWVGFGSSSGGQYDLVVVRRGGDEPGWIQLTVWGTSLEHATENGSIGNPAESASPGMLTVGAARHNNINKIESYSSQGPLPDGRIKPDLVGADCGETATWSLFCGTSQASPHVAGMVALVRQRFPQYTPAEVAAYLKDNAEQRVSSPDPNNIWGHGFAVLPPISPHSGPGGLSPTISATTPYSLTVSWDEPAGGPFIDYDVRYRISGSGAAFTDARHAGTARTATLTGLTPDTTYEVQVRATNAMGPGAWSGLVQGRTKPLLPGVSGNIPIYYFPHLAVGAGWQTTITYINYSPQDVTCQTHFISDHGSALPVSFPGLGKTESRTDVLPPGGSVHEETNVSPQDPPASGWALAACSGPVKASLLFRGYNSQGAPTGEAGVNATEVPATRFVTFAEQATGQAGTGVAYANPSSTEARITFTAKDEAGQTLDSKGLTVLPGGHGAQNMVDLFSLSSFTGSLEVTSTEPIVSLSLNAEAAPVFSSLPPGEPNAAAQGPTTYYFPHLAVGASWQTTITYINYSSAQVICRTDFISDHGGPLLISFPGLGMVDSRTDVLPPGGSVHEETDMNLALPLALGWARATCSEPVKASLLFRQYDSQGAPVAEAGVNAATVPATRFVTFAEQATGQAGTGVACANPSASNGVSVFFTVRNTVGHVLRQAVKTLLPGEHDAHVMAGLFGLTSFTGSLEITSTEPIVSLSLNFEATPVFSSLPPGEVVESAP